MVVRIAATILLAVLLSAPAFSQAPPDSEAGESHPEVVLPFAGS